VLFAKKFKFCKAVFLHARLIAYDYLLQNFLLTLHSFNGSSNLDKTQAS